MKFSYTLHPVHLNGSQIIKSFQSKGKKPTLGAGKFPFQFDMGNKNSGKGGLMNGIKGIRPNKNGENNELGKKPSGGQQNKKPGQKPIGNFNFGNQNFRPRPNQNGQGKPNQFKPGQFKPGQFKPGKLNIPTGQKGIKPDTKREVKQAIDPVDVKTEVIAEE